MIFSAPFYQQINKMFKAKCKSYYKVGNDKPHKPVIEKKVMKKLEEYFKNWKNNPAILTPKLFGF